MKRVLVTGSRDWTDKTLIEFELEAIDTRWADREYEEITLVSGACPTGADLMAEEIAKELGWTIEQHPADWGKFGKSAGPRRNAEMVNLGADWCLAFIKNNSRGASGTAQLARDAGIQTRTIREEA